MRAEAWQGLKCKARDARPFLPAGLCNRCDVVEESQTHVVREVTIAEQDLGEIITLEPQWKVTFFQAAGPREGRSSTSSSRMKTVRCSGACTATSACVANSRTARKLAEQMQFDSENGDKAALLSTLKRARELRAEGKL
jgi:hypothetical protein